MTIYFLCLGEISQSFEFDEMLLNTRCRINSSLVLAASFAGFIQGDVDVDVDVDIDNARNINTAQTQTLTTIACDDKCWNGMNCDLDICKGCSFSCKQRKCNLTRERPTCKTWCLRKSDCSFQTCEECLFCNNNSSSKNKKESFKSCPIITFKDKTDVALSKSKNYWSQWNHSGRPYFHDRAPLFLDIDGDQILDYFNPMHGHPIDNIYNIQTRLELALSEQSTAERGAYSLRQISRRIIIEEGIKIENIDAHGCVVADLDGDGYLDILISNGGGRGLVYGSDSLFDNLLLWGEPSLDDATGQKITVFRGGREAARAAGLEMRLGRGRYMFTNDANGDDLLDLFSAQDRVISNDIVPGIMLINQGDRTWKRDTGMTEYTRAIILTDANGDGYADEILLNRGFCYPRRKGPDKDYAYPGLGPFTKDIKVFCSSRPVDTTAVYRFNKSRMQMQEISKPYTNFSAAHNKQPRCCPHGLYESENNCSAEAIVSADFDGDQKADHIYLYRSKMVFFFSTDRKEGELLIQSKHEGLELKFPSYCAEALSVKVVDFDNDGEEEIFVVCKNAGIFLFYTKGSSKSDWSLANGCNEMETLGVINDRFRASATHDDIWEFCNNQVMPNWRTAVNVCETYQRQGELTAAITSGVSIVDLNNDGFLDIAVAHSFGYLRFFYSTPSKEKATNKYIVFDLDKDGLIKNNGLGMTLVLYCTDNSGRVVKQFREISNYPLATDMVGASERRVIFGLGKQLSPKKMLLRFPNKTKKEIDLSNWKFSEEITNLNDFMKEAKSGSCYQCNTSIVVAFMAIGLTFILW
jgi:hypothetical protein